MCDCIFTQRVLIIHRTASAFCLLHGWCRVKLLPSQCRFCVHHTSMHGDGKEYRNKSQHRKLTLEKKILRCSCQESNPRPFDHKSVAVPASQRLLLFICSRAHSLRSIRIRLGMIGQHTACLEYPRKWLQRCLNFTWLMPRETVAVSAHVLCTPYIHAPVYSVTSFEVVAVVVMV